MKISYKSVISIFGSEYTLLTTKEFLKEYQSLIDSSVETAKSIEDYEYLSVLTGENDKYDNFLVILKGHLLDTELPIILERDRSLTLFDFAKLFFETSIEKELFYKVIELEAIGQDMSPDSLYLQFDLYIKKFQEFKKLVHTKVHRNDPCPCGSNKKYKFCCGIGLS